MCDVEVGMLNVVGVCFDNNFVEIKLVLSGDVIIFVGFEIIYVLILGNELFIEGVNEILEFIVSIDKNYCIYLLVYDFFILDLSIVEIGVIIGFEVNSFLL